MKANKKVMSRLLIASLLFILGGTTNVLALQMYQATFEGEIALAELDPSIPGGTINKSWDEYDGMTLQMKYLLTFIDSSVYQFNGTDLSFTGFPDQPDPYEESFSMQYLPDFFIEPYTNTGFIYESDPNDSDSEAWVYPRPDQWYSPETNILDRFCIQGSSWWVRFYGPRLTKYGDLIDTSDSPFTLVDIEPYSTHSVPVPEPATILLLGAGLAGLAGTSMRIKKKA